jgi:glycine dehydrogenase
VEQSFSFGRFARRHLGSNPPEVRAMLAELGLNSLPELIHETVPASIRLERELDLPPALSEEVALAEMQSIAEKNQVYTSYLGMGYTDCFTPAVIRRNILENPGWYTAYTPYQAEISQGRMEALLNFQTLITDLTGMEMANASLLDEATAAAEAMAMCQGIRAGKRFLVDAWAHPQTKAVLALRAEPHQVEIVEFDPEETMPLSADVCGVLLQYPDTLGRVRELTPLINQAHEAKIPVVVACDLLALTLLQPPGECGADIVVGSAQRFGVPLGYGGPHAAFLATKEEHKRRLPGRLIGVSRDADGRPALRLTLQTREQHIRREKATSNICTAQVLLAVMASMYAVYHGPAGLRHIASGIHSRTRKLARGLRQLGLKVSDGPCFDTLCVSLGDTLARDVERLAESFRLNVRVFDAHTITLTLDETTHDLETLLRVFHHGNPLPFAVDDLSEDGTDQWPAALHRTTPYLTHPVFHKYHTETEMLRYIRRLESRDLSLTTSMIPLGSCTMKLNATAEMLPVTWEKIGRLHPFVPVGQAEGYQRIFSQLENWLAEITGFAAVSLQPNAGSQGEFAGLIVIREYLRSLGQGHRNVCVIPTSAHGTNPASAVMAGFRVVPVKCDAEGNIDLADLRLRVEENQDSLGAIMVTYPSTHGVFEESIREVCELIHAHGGQVYLDGANLNAQVGLCRPGDFGADVCHLNLHKTFCIPHGGGGPGVGPIGVAQHLAPFLPGHPVIPTGGEQACGPISAAPWGSASINVIPWMYIAMMGPDGLRLASELSILHANYIARRLRPYFTVLYTNRKGWVAHECIIDFREWKTRAGIDVEDVAKRLMDYGFHSPTMSWPVAGTLMIEPTESESKEEIDRFCEALIAIHGELLAIENGQADRVDNVLKNAPHPARRVIASSWERPYTRETAAYPAPWLQEHKFWPAVGRIDNVFGDRNVFCTCPPWEEAPQADAAKSEVPVG